MADGSGEDDLPADVVEQGDAIDTTQADADVRGEPVDDPYAELATEMGWVPQDQYKGDPEKWRGAKDYIKFGVQGAASLKRDLKATKDTVERLSKTSATIMARELEKQRADLEARHAQAVEDNDAVAARRVAKEIDALDASAKTTGDNPDERFASENPWYGKDDDATAYAISISQREAAKGKTIDEQLEAAAAGVRKRFPELFEQKQQRQAPPVNIPNSRASGLQPREKGFAELPAEAKKAWENYDRDFKRRGFAEGYPKDEYAKEFWGQSAAA